MTLAVFDNSDDVNVTGNVTVSDNRASWTMVTSAGSLLVYNLGTPQVDISSNSDHRLFVVILGDDSEDFYASSIVVSNNSAGSVSDPQRDVSPQGVDGFLDEANFFIPNEDQYDACTIGAIKSSVHIAGLEDATATLTSSLVVANNIVSGGDLDLAGDFDEFDLILGDASVLDLGGDLLIVNNSACDFDLFDSFVGCELTASSLVVANNSCADDFSADGFFSDSLITLRDDLRFDGSNMVRYTDVFAFDNVELFVADELMIAGFYNGFVEVFVESTIKMGSDNATTPEQSFLGIMYNTDVFLRAFTDADVTLIDAYINMYSNSKVYLTVFDYARVSVSFSPAYLRAFHGDADGDYPALAIQGEHQPRTKGFDSQPGTPCHSHAFLASGRSRLFSIDSDSLAVVGFNNVKMVLQGSIVFRSEQRCWLAS